MKTRLRIRTLAFLACSIFLPTALKAATPPPPDDALIIQLADVENIARPYPWLFTGGQPDSKALAALAAAGVQDVFNLRMPSEPCAFDEHALVESMGLRYLPMPTRASDFTDAKFTAFRHHLIAHGPKHPMFVHCASGNRVGAALLPWLVLDMEVPEDSAIAVAQSLGLRDPDLTRRALEYIRARQ